MANDHDNKRLWLGILFFILGAVWLLDNLNFYYFDHLIPHYVFTWRTFLILLGAYLFFGREKRIFGAILMVIGAFHLMDEIFWWWHIDFWDIIWPTVLVFLGIALITRRGHTGPSGPSDPDYIDDMSVFGGGEKKISSQNFKGGKLTAVFGGSKIDLRNAEIAEKSEVILDMFVLFGGTEIIVPADWTVKMETTVLFGGLSDKRQSVLNVVSNPDKTLIVKGIVLFGGGELKSI